MEKRILRLHKGGTGILKIGKTLGVGTGTVQRVLMEQPRPFDVDVAKASLNRLLQQNRSLAEVSNRKCR